MDATVQVRCYHVWRAQMTATHLIGTVGGALQVVGVGAITWDVMRVRKALRMPPLPRLAWDRWTQAVVWPSRATLGLWHRFRVVHSAIGTHRGRRLVFALCIAIGLAMTTIGVWLPGPRSGIGM